MIAACLVLGSGTSLTLFQGRTRWQDPHWLEQHDLEQCLDPPFEFFRSNGILQTTAMLLVLAKVYPLDTCESHGTIRPQRSSLPEGQWRTWIEASRTMTLVSTYEKDHRLSSNDLDTANAETCSDYSRHHHDGLI
jgi:hypothetical protein